MMEEDDYDPFEHADILNKEAKENREVCILNLDSPSYPPETDEYRQCGCSFCLKEYKKRIAEDVKETK